MTPDNKKLLIYGGVGVVGVGILFFVMKKNSSSASNTGPSNAVDPNAQVGAGAFAQGTMPDIGNLLSYNQPVGVAGITPQATSVMTGVTGDYNSVTSGTAGWGGAATTVSNWMPWTAVGEER